MSELEQVSKEMMDELDDLESNFLEYDISPLKFLIRVFEGEKYPNVKQWYVNTRYSKMDDQIKLIEHIYLNEPQFEAEKPKKWIVRSKTPNALGEKWVLIDAGIEFYQFLPITDCTVKFDTKEEAEKWTNPQTEVVEVEE